MRTRRCGIPALLLHGSLLLASLATVCASTGLIVYLFAYKDQAAERLFGAHPVYAAGPLNADPLADYGPVFTVGHNAGASLTTTRQAIANGADVVEIDIVAMRGKLVSAHQPPAWVGPVTFQGPTLEQVWRAARNAEVIQLDLKESTPAFRKLLFAFLDKHAGEHTVLVATSDVAMLDEIRDRHPEVLRFLSVPNHGRLERLLADTDLAESIDGVTIRYQLVSAESVRRLKAMGLTVLAWTVNDLATVNEFVSWGVDGISTNNLSIMELLSGQGSGAGALSRETADAGGEPGADL
jgi:glycerophosphoryl diester phosphodiesterase